MALNELREEKKRGLRESPEKKERFVPKMSNSLQYLTTF